ncbi:MAG: PDZ domain-containing protein [Gemmataceae bacterium]|jgi:hypothetical protein|nr:PDZ domain-containing protein [Gemmataceae bacterium]
MFRRFVTSLILGGLAISPILAQDKTKPATKPEKPARVNPLVQDFQRMLEMMKLAGFDDKELKDFEDFLKDFPLGGNAQAPAPGLFPPIGPAFPAPPAGGPAELDDLLKQMQALQKAQLEALMRLQGGLGGGRGIGFMIGPDGRARRLGNFGTEQEARLGVKLEGLPELLREHLDLPKGQGLVFTDVPAQSVAGKAGILPNDVLVEFNGKPVPNDTQEFAKIVKEVKPDTPVDMVVIRKGKKETIKEVKLPELKTAAPAPVAPLVPFPMLPGFGGPVEQRAAQLKVEQNDSVFSVLYNVPDLRITITGMKEDGKHIVESIEIQEGKDLKKYESIDQVPEKYKSQIEKMMERVK